jgi:hypothetical protein
LPTAAHHFNQQAPEDTIDHHGLAAGKDVHHVKAIHEMLFTIPYCAPHDSCAVQLREIPQPPPKSIHFPRNCLARDVLLKTRPPAIPPFIPALPQIKRHKASYPKGKKMKPEHRQRLLAALILTAFGTPALAPPIQPSSKAAQGAAGIGPQPASQLQAVKNAQTAPAANPATAADDENTASKEDINGLQADLETSSIRSSATATPAPPCRRAPST